MWAARDRAAWDAALHIMLYQAFASAAIRAEQWLAAVAAVRELPAAAPAGQAAVLL